MFFIEIFICLSTEPYVTEEMETGEKTALMASLQIQEVYCFLVNEGKCREGSKFAEFWFGYNI